MSEVPIKEERDGDLPAAVEMNAEETAGAAQTYQRQCNVIPTGQQPPMPVANNDHQMQYIPNISMPSYILQSDAQMYYTVDYSSPYQLPPNPGPGHHPQAVMGVMAPSSSSALISRRPADDQGKRAQRLLKNREAAKQSRARKKHYHEIIKTRLNELEADNKMLRERLSSLSYLTQPNVYSNAPLPLLPSYGGQ